MFLPPILVTCATPPLWGHYPHHGPHDHWLSHYQAVFCSHSMEVNTVGASLSPPDAFLLLALVTAPFKALQFPRPLCLALLCTFLFLC